MPIQEELQNAKEKAVLEHYRRKPEKESRTPAGLATNVIGIGIGRKNDVGELCVRFYVDWKIEPPKAIDKAFRIPKKYGRVKTDVIETGRFCSFQLAAGPGTTIGLNREGLRPNVDPSTTGTMGLVVEMGEDFYVLGSNHVMVVNGRVPVGTRIIFKRPRDFGRPIFAATTNHYIPLSPTEVNYVDCALAKLIAPVRAELPAAINIDPDSAAVVKPKRGMKVTRVDQTEAPTGKIVDVDLRMRIDFRFGTFDFDNLVLIDSDDEQKPFARPGDSGSLVVGQNNNDPGQNEPTALIVGGVGKYTIACPLKKVFEELNGKLNAERKGLAAGNASEFKPVLKSKDIAKKFASVNARNYEDQEKGSKGPKSATER